LSGNKKVGEIMKYYTNYYEVSFNKDTNDIDFVLKSKDDNFVITEIEGDNSLSPINIIEYLLDIMLDEKIKYISCLEELKSIKDLCVGDYFIYFTMGEKLKNIYHIIEIGDVLGNNTRILNEVVIEI
jgi:hypothetical protein